MTLEVTLDNSRSQEDVNYRVAVAVNAEDNFIYDQVHNVPAGEVQNVVIPVKENSYFGLTVFDEEDMEELLYKGIGVDCTPGDEPRVNIGDVNCTTLTVPVTLDNTRSSVETRFRVTASSPIDHYEESFLVAAGAERVVRVPVDLIMYEGYRIWVESDLGTRFPEWLVSLDCERAAAGPGQGPSVAVKDATLQLPQTGGLNFALPLLGVALLAAGGGMVALSGRRPRH
jgi:LPXTG-motif cell wall-anchored protein